MTIHFPPAYQEAILKNLASALEGYLKDNPVESIEEGMVAFIDVKFTYSKQLLEMILAYSKSTS